MKCFIFNLPKGSSIHVRSLLPPLLYVSLWNEGHFHSEMINDTTADVLSVELKSNRWGLKASFRGSWMHSGKLKSDLFSVSTCSASEQRQAKRDGIPKRNAEAS